MVQQAIQNRRGQRAVIVEDARPILVDAIAGDDGRNPFITLADDLEQQIRPQFIVSAPRSASYSVKQFAG